MSAEEPTKASPDKAFVADNAVVLLVEDETVVREITGQVLQRAGYRVLESSGPKEALHVAGTHAGKIDLLLTDVIMPGMNGIELAKEIGSLQPDLVTVFMSGYAECDAMRKMRASSAMHIQKPFTIDVLLARIAEALNGRRERSRVPPPFSSA